MTMCKASFSCQHIPDSTSRKGMVDGMPHKKT